MENNFVVYMHTAPNGKAYIGQTNNLTKRNHGHQSKTGCRAFYNAIQKYGWDSFKHTILAEGLSLDEANILEAELIAKHKTLAPNGYNLRTGGDNSKHSAETIERQRAAKLGKKHSPEFIEKISLASRSQSPETREKQRLSRIGRKHSEETKAKIAASKIGKKRPPEVCEKIRKAKQNMPVEVREKISASLRGRSLSEDTKAKLSQAHKGRIKSETERANLSSALKNRKFSEETRAKMSESARKRFAEGRNPLLNKKEAAQGDLFL